MQPFSPMSFILTIRGFTGSAHIAGIKWIRALAPLFGHDARIGLRDAKNTFDKIEGGEVILSVPCSNALVLQLLREDAERHGFITGKPKMREVILADLIEPRQDDEIPF